MRQTASITLLCLTAMMVSCNQRSQTTEFKMMTIDTTKATNPNQPDTLGDWDRDPLTILPEEMNDPGIPDENYDDYYVE